MKSVLVLGLGQLKNWGENFLIDCARYAIDRNGGFASEEGNLEPEMAIPKKLVYYSLICLSRVMPHHDTSVRIEYAAVRFRCKKTYEKAMEGKDAVLFGAGSFKYGTQKLWAYYSLAVEIAQRRGIPVMFNAMNVQKFDACNAKCRLLASHADRLNVKVITTRDGEEGLRRLREDYGVGSHVFCDTVGDMAYWIPECYGIHKREHSDLVGINLLAGSNFKRYGHNFTEEQLLDFYLGVIKYLDEHKIRWKLFINGLPSDKKFGKKLLSRLGDNTISIENASTAAGMLKLVASFRVVLGGRLHTCISSYAMDVPVIGFYWDEKMNRFASLAKAEDLFYEESELNAVTIGRKIVDLFRKGYSYDVENRDYWKKKTMCCIDQFLDSIAL